MTKKEKSQVVHYTVTMTLPVGATPQDVREYISDAVMNLCDNLHLAGPLSGHMTFTVSNVRYIPKAGKDD